MQHEGVAIADRAPSMARVLGREGVWVLPAWSDPRIPFAAILTVYAILGCTVLGFNRTPAQMLLIIAAGCALDVGLHYLLRERRLLFPLSAYISSLSLALLLNFSHDSFLLFLPVYLTIGSKYVFTYDGKHVFNPSMFGVAVSLLIGGDLITTAPAYQWGGSLAMSAFIITAALALFVFKVGRSPLIVAFLLFYTVQVAFRAHIMRWYLPPEALFLGTLTSAPFFLFVFFMITDPKTSPSSTSGQIALALALTLVDLVLHRKQSLFTFFYAALIVGSARFCYLHAARLAREGMWNGLRRSLLAPRSLRTGLTLGLIGAGGIACYRTVIHPAVSLPDPGFRLQEIRGAHSGIAARPGRVLEEVDPRLRHIGKWLLSAGDAVAVGDYDNDGLQDLFLTGPLMRPEDRSCLYRNLGDLRFERVPIPCLDAMRRSPDRCGLASFALFVDDDNDGDQDLFLAMGYGKCRLLRNRLSETGRPAFVDATAASGIDEYTVSIGANFFDMDRDGRLDLLIANAMAPYLEQYAPPRPLNIFRLPEPAYPGDRRMFPFMHASWHQADNGGLNALYRRRGGGFEKLDARAWGMPETHWSLAVGTGDLNRDGWTDLYVANDFGPDDLYLNKRGEGFYRMEGGVFGTIGRDTYKGMNSSLGDIDRNGYLDVYVSNVHVPLQAEGSLLWMTRPDPSDRRRFLPKLTDEATRRGALNENRFGWGAALGDLNNDGWLDIVQANGMVDDRLDRRFDDCPSYWYLNEKLMRSGPEIHTYADMWGDLRGHCINGKEANRVYMSRGDVQRLQFVDVAPQLGLTDLTPSRGAALVDFDNDGDLDLLITHQSAPASLYRNTIHDAPPAAANRGDGPRSHWIGFQLAGTGQHTSRDAVGTQVFVSSREEGSRARQLREVQISNGLSAQSDRRLHFGLGSDGGPVTARVSWYGGQVVEYRGLRPGRYYLLRQGEERAVPLRRSTGNH